MRSVIDLVGWTIIHFAWQGAVIGGLAAAILRALSRRSAQARYLTACLALLAMLIAPVITAVAISNAGPRRVSEPVHADVPLLSSPGDRAVAPAGPRLTAGAPRSSPDRDLLLPLVLAWAIGVSISLLRLTTAWWRVRALHRTSLRTVASALQPVADRLAQRIGLSHLVHVVDSIHVETPSVVGSLRPVILLPLAALAALTPAQVEAILAHELAHICRRDYLINMLQSIAEAMLFFHPAVWWVSGRIRAEREHCCDDIAVAVSGDAVDYARALAHLALWQRGMIAPLAAAANGGSLLDRIQRLVGDRRDDAQPRANIVTPTLVVALLVLIGSGLQYSSSAAVGLTSRLRAETPAHGAVTTVASFRLVPPPPVPPPAPLPGLQADLAFAPTDHFDVYFPQQLRGRIDLIVRASEDAYAKVSGDLRYDLASRPVVVLFATRTEVERAPSIVTFGSTALAPRILIAADAAASRLAGTLRHEITHAFVFDILPGGSAPRWIHEGLAEYERGELDAASLTTLRALAARSGLPAITRIDDIAFRSNPRLDDALGAQVFEFIASRWGWDGIRRFLLATRTAGGPRSDVFVDAFGMSADAFDRAFASYVESAPQAGVADAQPDASARSSAAGQTPRATRELTFETASIKPNTTGDLRVIVQAQAGGGFRAVNAPLRLLVRFAYQLQNFELEGGGQWVRSARFDVTARAGRNASLPELREMLRALLRDRFSLRTHTEMRDAPLYALIVEPGGHRLRPSPGECGDVWPSAEPDRTPTCGFMGPSPDFNGSPVNARMAIRGMSMDQFARLLEGPMGRGVVDRTGLSGYFDADFDITSEFGPPPPPPGLPDPFNRESRPSLSSVLPDQLGLRLDSQRGRVQVVVIDDATRPADN